VQDSFVPGVQVEAEPAVKKRSVAKTVPPKPESGQGSLF
jgi:hypothetical protein